MKKLVALLCAVWMVASMTACAGPTADDGKYVIGICQIQPHVALDAATKGFKDALIEELGAENLVFKEQDAAGETNTCSTIINTFVSEKVDLILANSTPVLEAAAAGTSVIPILGTSVTEYGNTLGIPNFNGTVGGNISGTSDLAPLDQQAAMIKTWCPDAKKVGLIYCSAEPNSEYQVQEVKKELEKLGFTCTLYPFAVTTDMPNITTQAANDCDVLYVPTDNTVASSTEIIDGICRPKKIPVFVGEEGICAGCGVATLSINYYDLGVTTGKMAAKILKGEAKIGEMPIAYVPQEDLAYKYNAEICSELGLTPPEGYIAIG